MDENGELNGKTTREGQSTGVGSKSLPTQRTEDDRYAFGDRATEEQERMAERFGVRDEFGNEDEFEERETRRAIERGVTKDDIISIDNTIIDSDPIKTKPIVPVVEPEPDPPPPQLSSIPFNIEIQVTDYATIPAGTLLKQVINEAILPEFDNYYDDMRWGKTLLNLRDNRQIPILNWKASGEQEVTVKLLDPLDTTQYPVNTAAFISREMLNTVFERIAFLPVDPQLIPQLRPSRSTKSLVGKSTQVTGTLQELIPNIGGGTGELSVSSSYVNFVSNNILENLYNTNTGMDINVDYSNFGNFVTFGSAQKRIDVFKGKLEEVERLVVDAPIFVENLNLSASRSDAGSYDTVFGTLDITSAGSASLSLSGSSQVYDLLTSGSTSATGSVDYVNSSINTSLKIQDLIRGLDDYERTLWFKTGLEYSSSDATYYQAPEQYKADFTYPEILGIPLATTNATSSTWYSEMSSIASDYDNVNINRLQYNVPKYLQEDADSSDFLVFTDLIGHHFDNVKIYISNLKNISSRYPKVDEEISGEMAKKVLESFGVSAPSIASVDSLINYMTNNGRSASYKDIADEYYTRYIHALPFLLRTKGTKQSVESLLNIFGINPDTLTVKESISNRYTTVEPVTITTTEQNFNLTINSGSHLVVPFSASLRSPQTIQSRFALLDDRTQEVFKFDNDYSIRATFHPSGSSNAYYANTGKLDLLSGSTELVTSSYFDLFDENYVSLQLQYDSAGAKFDIRKIEGEETTFSQSLQETQTSMSADWSGLSELYIGIPALSASADQYTYASLDEFRMWGEQITEKKFIEFAENPGVFAGNSYTSSLQDLYVRLSFNLPTDVSESRLTPNTTPYAGKTASLNITNVSSSGFSSGTSPLYQTTRNTRTVIQHSYDASATTQATDMIRIAPAAPSTMSLSSNSTTVSIYDKFFSSSVGSSELDISISPVDAIDRQIARSFGSFNLGNLIGRPIDRTSFTYTLLDDFQDVFVRDLAPSIDYNNFIRFFDKFLHLFYESVEQYLPARSRVKKGIVIRPSVLDRVKVNTRTNLKFSGETSRRTSQSLADNDFDIIRSFDTSLSLTPIQPSASQELFGVFNNIDTSYSIPQYSDTIRAIPVAAITSSYNTYTGSLNVYNEQTFITASTLGDDTGSFGELEAVLTRPKKDMGVITIDVDSAGFGTASISPINDTYFLSFDKYPNIQPVNTYFTNPHGLYYVDERRNVPVTESFMREGIASPTTWSAGISYKYGDVVLQRAGTTGSDGKTLTENGRLFAFKNQGASANAQVVSYNAPQTDTRNWLKVLNKPEVFQKLVRVAYVNGETDRLAVLTNLTASYDSVPSEYTLQVRRPHIKFIRDDSLGARRRTYLGTLNTINTTVDNGPAFEVFDININILNSGDPQPCIGCD